MNVEVKGRKEGQGRGRGLNVDIFSMLQRSARAAHQDQFPGTRQVYKVSKQPHTVRSPKSVATRVWKTSKCIVYPLPARGTVGDNKHRVTLDTDARFLPHVHLPQKVSL
jgi:hypothetical protein